MWADHFTFWVSDGTPVPSAGVDWSQWGLAGVVGAAFGVIILRTFAQMRDVLLGRVAAAEQQLAAGIAAAKKERDDDVAEAGKQRDEAIAREHEARMQERERADRLEAALAKLNAEVGPRQAQVLEGAMKAVTDAIRELKR